MTVEEAIALHEKYKTAGFVQSVRMDIDELVKMVICQSNEIDLLKCCGNCEYWNQTYNQCEEPEYWIKLFYSLLTKARTARS